MKKTRLISESENFTAVDIGKLSELADHSLIHPKSGQEVKGKVFLKNATNATGTEISFQIVPSRTDLGYFHIHNQNEETYIILKGEGKFQVDEDCFPVSEGSVIRVSPAGIRSLSNTSDNPMIYIVIQSKEGSLSQYSSDDGQRVDYKPKWE